MKNLNGGYVLVITLMFWSWRNWMEKVLERLNLNQEQEDDEDECGTLLVNLPWPQKLPEESRELSRFDEERRDT